MSPHTCPQCGIEITDSQHPNRKYCSRNCWLRHGEVDRTKVCKLCGNSFTEKKKTSREFCSGKCSRLWLTEIRIDKCETCGKEFHQSTNGKKRFCSDRCNPKYSPKTGRRCISDPSKHSEFVCKECHKTFVEWTYRKPTFCSNHCRSVYAARQPKPKARRPENHLDLVCETCGKAYKVHKIYNSGNRHSRFCSIACRAEWTSFARRGPGNPNWTGGENPSKYGPNWLSQARKARKRDKQLCQVCKTKPCKRLDVHHIIPIRDFDGDWENANKLENLITLCRVHHFQVEKGRIPCPTGLKQ